MSELNDLYQEVILDHSRHPHNYRAMTDSSRQAEGYNPLCGDQVTVFLKMKGDQIEDVSFQGNGCAISKSSASLMTDMVKGKSAQETTAMFEKFRLLVTGETKPSEDPTDKMSIFAGVSEFPTRVKCAVLGWHTLKSALDNKKQQVNTESL